MLSNIKSNKFIKNTSWLVIEKIMDMVITLIIGALTTRYLGPENYGLLNYSLSFVAIFTFISNLGLDGIIMKYLIHNKNEEAEIIGSSIVMRIISSTLCIVLIIITVYILEPDNKGLLVISFIQSFSLIFKSFEVIEIWFQSKLNSRRSVIVKISASLVIAIYKIILIVNLKSVEWFAFSLVLQSIIIAIMLTFIYIIKEKKNMALKVKTSKKLINESYHFILSGMIMVIYTQMDKIMIGKLMSNTEVGYYSAAMTIAQMWFFIPYAVINSARPIIIRTKKENELGYQEKLLKLFSFIIITGSIVGIGISIFSKPIINILFGKEYLEASGVLVISVWAGIFSLLGVARDIWYISEDKLKFSKIFISYGAIINIGLNLILIPIWGINGAALATGLTQMSVCFIIPLFLNETKEVSILMIKSLKYIKQVKKIIKF